MEQNQNEPYQQPTLEEMETIQKETKRKNKLYEKAEKSILPSAVSFVLIFVVAIFINMAGYSFSKLGPKIIMIALVISCWFFCTRMMIRMGDYFINELSDKRAKYLITACGILFILFCGILTGITCMYFGSK